MSEECSKSERNSALIKGKNIPRWHKRNAPMSDSQA